MDMTRDEIVGQWKIEHKVGRSGKQGMTRIRITGRDRVKFLQGFTTNDMQSIKKGEYAETFLLNIKGKILGHGVVLAGDEALIFLGTAGQQAKLLAHLDRYIITEHVQLSDESEAYTSIFLVGELPADIQEKLGLQQTGDHTGLSFQQVRLNDHEVMVVRRNNFFTPVLQVIFPISQEAKLIESLDLKILGEDEFEVLRILSGQPIYGKDISEENLGQECSRTANAISFHKGCYLGQEPIARIDALGHVNQKLRIVIWEGADEDIQDSGKSPILLADPDTQKPLGVISSVASWKKQLVGLGVIKRHVAERETSFYARLESGKELQLRVDWINGE
jgi:folate-binding protein YgfZ